MKALGLLVLLALASGCEKKKVAPPPTPSTTASAAPRSAMCHASSECDAGTHCTVEDGECGSDCPPDSVCPQVCAGHCAPGPGKAAK